MSYKDITSKHKSFTYLLRMRTVGDENDKKKRLKGRRFRVFSITTRQILMKLHMCHVILICT